MSGEKCKSGHLSWLMKSCLPNPQEDDDDGGGGGDDGINSPMSSLPDDLLLECLCRISPSSFSLPCLSLVCRRWFFLLLSPRFLHLRRLRFPLSPTLFSLLTSARFATLRLGLDSHWKLSSFSLPPSISSHSRLSAIGPHLYLIGRTSFLRFDTWTRALTARSPTVYSRKKFASAVVSGKIYVAGGTSRTSSVEEYDPDRDTWRLVSVAPRRRYGCFGASADGVFYVIGGLRIGLEDRTEAHNVYASSMDLYEVGRDTWLRSRALPDRGCVVAACSLDGHVYVLASHAVELSFWRFDGRRRGEGSFGEWRKLKSPPLRAQARLDTALRFSCTGVGKMVVLIRVMGCMTVRRGRREGDGHGMTNKEVMVMVYDCDGDEWSRGPNMPDVIPRSTCVCVEC